MLIFNQKPIIEIKKNSQNLFIIGLALCGTLSSAQVFGVESRDKRLLGEGDYAYEALQPQDRRSNQPSNEELEKRKKDERESASYKNLTAHKKVDQKLEALRQVKMIEGLKSDIEDLIDLLPKDSQELQKKLLRTIYLKDFETEKEQANNNGPFALEKIQQNLNIFYRRMVNDFAEKEKQAQEKLYDQMANDFEEEKNQANENGFEEEKNQANENVRTNWAQIDPDGNRFYKSLGRIDDLLP